MIKLIIEKELKDIISSTKFAVTFGVSSVLILLSFYVGGRNYQIGAENYQAAMRAEFRTFEGFTDWKQVRDHSVFLPPQPITSLVMGVSNDIGRITSVTAGTSIDPEDSRYGDEPMYAVFRFLDLEFIFQIVLSLFAILFAYDAVNGEKEHGTLRLTFSNSVQRGTYILAKIAGSFLALALPLLVPILLGVLLLVLMGIPLQQSDWLRLFLVIVAGYLYFGAFLAIALFVSSRTEKSSTSFLLALVIWVFSVMIVPRAAVLFAGRAVDVPSVDEITSKRSRYSASLWQEDRKKMSDYKVPPGVPMDQVIRGFQGFMQQMGEERDAKIRDFTARLDEDRANRLRVQEQWAFAIARLSPSAAFSLTATAAAGTGIRLKDEFTRAAERYQGSFAEFLKEKTGETPSGGMIFRTYSDDKQQQKPPINATEIPTFTFQPQPVEAVLGSVAVNFGILALFNIIFFAGAFVSFLRYDVR
jgi:ABC-type transport system involved in multi-copper enzyme maturation permease subunit